MEISSLSGVSGMQMGSMRPPKGPPPTAEEMSTQLIEEQDADGDGFLSASEVDFNEDEFATIDADGDGILSQKELLTDAQKKIDEMETRKASGDLPGMSQADSAQSLQLLQTLRSEGSSGNQSLATQQYGLMQELMSGDSSEGLSSYFTGLMTSQGLNIAV